jgi:hypothetical protein
MTVQELIDLAQLRINYLNSQKSAVVQTGNVTELTRIETELLQTQDTINLLQGLVTTND